MKVKEIQNLAPKAEVYELRADAKYLVLLDPRYVSQDMGARLVDALDQLEVKAMCLWTAGTVRILELEK